MRPQSTYEERNIGDKRSLAYDQYAEMSKQTQAARANVAINAAQAVIMSQMSASLNNISAVMQDVRSHQADALAIQQELLQEDRLQAYIEEFIYSTEKLVAECSKKECELALSTRYFLLLGVTKTVQQQGLATPVIRGRDNKAAFENGLENVQKLLSQLEQEAEVKEAIAWSEEERRKREEEAERARKAKQKRQAEIKNEIGALTQKKNSLVSQRGKIDWSKLGGFVQAKYSQLVDGKSTIFKLFAYSQFTILGPFYTWQFYSEQTSSINNDAIDKEIAELDSQINRLSAKLQE